MIIKNINKIISGSEAKLSAEIEFEGEETKQLFFSFDRKYEDLLVEDASPFVAALLVCCMSKGEDMKIDGEISEKLSKSLAKIMQMLSGWNQELKKIKIETGIIEEVYKGKFIGCFFSGGVDSFYSLLKPRNKNDQISHMIFVQGLDIELVNKELFEDALENVKKTAEELGKNIIVCRTNIREISDSIVVWDWQYGAALASIALCLRKGFKKILIAGADAWQNRVPSGSHPELDNHWSTESLAIEQDGSEFTRLEKVGYISDFPIALSLLRVCCRNYKGVINCCQCEKCLRTMIALYIVGKLDHSEAFSDPIDTDKVRTIFLSGREHWVFMEENLEALKRKDIGAEIQGALEESINKSKNITLKQRFFNLLRDMDRKYNRRRVYRFVFQRKETNERKLLFNLFVRIGLIR